MKTPPSIRTVCVVMLVCMIAGAAAGVYQMALRATETPQAFRSLAKLVAGGSFYGANFPLYQENMQDFYGAIIETMESPEMLRKARERVQALHPELKACEVSIDLRQTKGSCIMNILATGAEPRYTQTFLNALLDEFMMYKKWLREQALGETLKFLLQEMANKEKAMDEALSKQQAVGRDAANILARVELERLTARLESLGNERDDLRMALKGTPANAAEKTARVTALEEEIKRLGVEITESEGLAAQLEAAKQRYAITKMAYEAILGQVESLQSKFIPVGDYVAIQERASPAAEYIEDWKMPMLIYGGSGAAAGLLAGLLASLFIALLRWANKPRQAGL